MRSHASEIIVLCEDKLHEVVARRFLTRGWNVKGRSIRVVPYPEGAGTGEGHVRNAFPAQLKAFRHRAARARTVLIAVIDADAGTVEDRRRELDAAAERAGLTPRSQGEAVVYIVSKCRMETWLAYLDGISVEEDESDTAGRDKTWYKREYGFKNRESDAHPLIDRLSRSCGDRTLEKPPDSLAVACEEFERIRESL